MGQVLKGRDPDLGRDVALKVLREDHYDKPDMVRRFVEEAQIGGQLQHPGIVPIYELGTFTDRRPFFSMKLVKGQTLAELLDGRESPADDLPRMLSIFEAICQTVAYAHARGAIHRDLKPSNVMVGSFGEVHVMDWGLAKVLPRGGVMDGAQAGKLDRQETLITTVRSGSVNFNLSHAGSVMGTPSYMAPEQARGEVAQVDERADVFALGSILCEILTGEPAFLGRTVGEILRKAAVCDTADALARLDGCGADAELVDLARHCLSREAADRPRTASAVADRIGGHLTGVQDRLRAAELARAAETARAEEATRTAAEADQRAQAERRARRFQVGLAASLLVLTTTGVLAFTYFFHERQAHAAKRDQVLAETKALLKKAQGDASDPVPWRDALAALGRVEDQGHEPRIDALRDEIQAGLDDAERTTTLRRELVEVCANQQDVEVESTDSGYSSAFQAAGLDLDTLEPAEFARRMRRQPEGVVVELAAFLDHWSAVRREAGHPVAAWRRPLEAARLADTDTYRDRLRALLLAEDRKPEAETLKALAAAPEAADLPPATAVLLGRTLADIGHADSSAALLRLAASRHPEDIWVNYNLATALGARPGSREEAVRYYTAARALRPESAHDLAHLLENMGRGGEAEAMFRDLVRRRPDSPRHLGCLGSHLKDRGREAEAEIFLDRAFTEYRTAIRLKPDLAGAHNGLGTLLCDIKHDYAAAEAEFRTAIQIKRDSAVAHHNLGNALQPQGKLDEAIAEYRTAIRLKPDLAVAHQSLGIALKAQGKLDEASAEDRTAIRLKPDLAEAHRSLGIALQAQGKLDDAVAEYRAAIRLKPDLAEAHQSLGTALQTQGKLDDAIAEYRTAIRLKPDLVVAHCNLGQILRSQRDYAGSLAEIRKGHELGSKQPGWHYPTAQWLQEAERLAALAARLPALLRGDDQPRDNAERLSLAQMCYDSKRHAAAAGLWTEALKTDPRLADDRQTQLRYNAACAAALAAAGAGKDEPPPDDAARAKLRSQALGWLKGEVVSWAKTLDGAPAQMKANIAPTLKHWKTDSDLAGIRDPEALAKLPDPERKLWQALWVDVEALLKRAEGPKP